MLDQIRHTIQNRLDELLSETEKLRHALTALSSRPGATAAKTNGTSSPRRQRRTAAAATAPRKPASSANGAPAPTARIAARTAPGATKTAVLAALASGSAMTASDVANATGLGRASVSTTLSKLAKTGQVTKADRGYQIAPHPSPDMAVAAAGATDNAPTA